MGLMKQTMHVVWQPVVDSGASGRPVLNCASASDVTAAGGSGGGLSSATRSDVVEAAVEAAATRSAAEAAVSDEPAGTCKLAWPSR